MAFPRRHARRPSFFSISVQWPALAIFLNWKMNSAQSLDLPSKVCIFGRLGALCWQWSTSGSEASLSESLLVRWVSLSMAWLAERRLLVVEPTLFTDWIFQWTLLTSSWRACCLDCVPRLACICSASDNFLSGFTPGLVTGWSSLRMEKICHGCRRLIKLATVKREI